jgi:hypothetical protein
MRRPALEIGVALVALGAVSVVEAWRLRDGWLGTRPIEELAEYLPLATKKGIRQ